MTVKYQVEEHRNLSGRDNGDVIYAKVISIHNIQNYIQNLEESWKFQINVPFGILRHNPMLPYSFEVGETFL
jgi:hypothetical protein